MGKTSNPKNNRYTRMWLALGVLWISSIACQPVIAIGYQELVIIILLTVIILGPLLFRIYRVLEKIRNERKTRE